ncbi:Gfo/Idh/MocA family oxidoreductase [Georgenia wutianyii]|uniref:Gfo/Idh/MocA family oxidoreductase n=1 Tax=Georgenia wutianyii TaxID=2585135 RepID=A0ABX5VS69_9MICO|nr:Gfo/Idh/MocA family oxidoreductase [Georgenia wutianyii]QDB79700.1 Gfo/Idh/MocA family oxidoreductase [Georgenia wutianyii]
MGSTQRVGVGIVGLGAIGVTHAQALHELRDRAELVAFSGGSLAAAAAVGWPEADQRSAADVVRSPDVDVVVSCSPSEFHARDVLEVLDAGKDVVVEKPMALSVADVDAIVTSAEQRGRTVSMISQHRFDPAHAQLKAMVDSGRLGDLRLARTHVHGYRTTAYYASADWRRSQELGGGVVMNQGVHNIDVLLWLAGEVVEVTAQVATLGQTMDAEDTAVATLRFASGALGALTLSTATPPGRAGTIDLDFTGGSVSVGQSRFLTWDVPEVPAPELPVRPVSLAGVSAPTVDLDGHVAQWRDVLDALDSGTAPLVDVHEAARTVRLLCAIYEAAATGRAVTPAHLT